MEHERSGKRSRAGGILGERERSGERDKSAPDALFCPSLPCSPVANCKFLATPLAEVSMNWLFYLNNYLDRIE